MIKERLISSLLSSALIIGLLWILFIIDEFLPTRDFIKNSFGIKPRMFSGMVGIPLYSLVHGSLEHILINTKYLFILLVLLKFFYQRIQFQIIILSALGSGLLIWIFGRHGNHIGASGLIFALFGFLLFGGLFRNSFILIGMAIVLTITYGTLIYTGLTTFKHGLSTEGHIFGFIVGSLLSYLYRNEPELIKNNNT